jgi:hypothetical protein
MGFRIGFTPVSWQVRKEWIRDIECSLFEPVYSGFFPINPSFYDDMDALFPNPIRRMEPFFHVPGIGLVERTARSRRPLQPLVALFISEISS